MGYTKRTAMIDADTDLHLLLRRDQGLRLVVAVGPTGRHPLARPDPRTAAHGLFCCGQSLWALTVGATAKFLAHVARMQMFAEDRSLNPFGTHHPCWTEMGWWIPEGC